VYEHAALHHCTMAIARNHVHTESVFETFIFCQVSGRSTRSHALIVCIFEPDAQFISHVKLYNNPSGDSNTTWCRSRSRSRQPFYVFTLLVQTTPLGFLRIAGRTMCLVQTPYYHLCGHYGRPLVAPNGRCARAEHTPGPCWEPQDIGIRTIESMCISCVRTVSILETHQPDPSSVGPVDCNKFNQLVKLHKQTCDRRYSPMLFTPFLSLANCSGSASETSSRSSITSSTFLQTADELAFRRPSAASEVSVTSTSPSTMSTRIRFTNPFV
jgi:hypothetical protein